MVKGTTIVEVMPELMPLADKKLLDAGCGVGGLVQAMVAKGADAWGIEPGADNIETARQKYPDRSDHFQVAGAENLPFDDASFDVVVFSNSLHHVPVALQPTALDECARVLRPGGQAVIAEPVPQGDHFNLSLPMEDETDVRNHALAAILDTGRHGLDITTETSFVRATAYGSFEDYRKAMILVDPGREKAFVERGDDLRANFKKFGRREGSVSIFDQEIRVHVLCKSS
jgi:SAM-dependent methyltransferase